MTRKPYPTDVSDEEWAFVAPYLTLVTEAAPQHDHSVREVFNGVRSLAQSPTEGNPPPELCAGLFAQVELGD